MKIKMHDERTETVITSEAQLDLKTGEISNVVYEPLHDFFNKNKDNLPFDDYEYMYTTGEIHIDDKVIEFKISTDSSKYQVNHDELEKLHKLLAIDNVVQKKLKP